MNLYTTQSRLINQQLSTESQVQCSPSRHLAFISLSLGFLVIWTTVLASVLVSRTLRDEGVAEETNRVFHTHEDIGRIVFTLGNELVYTVDCILSTMSLQTQQGTINATRSITDKVLQTAKKGTSKWVNSVASVLDALEEKLNAFRTNLIITQTSPQEIFNFYKNLNSWLLQRCFLLDYAGRHLPVPGLPYTLFIRGMSQKFAELTLGIIHFKSSIAIDKSEFLLTRAGSQELISAAFHFISKTSVDFSELEEQESHLHQMTLNINDIASNNFTKNYKEQTTTYLKEVKEQMAMLQLKKDFLNETLAYWVQQLSLRSHNTLAFHLSIAIVALVAVMICVIVTGCSCSYLTKEEVEKQNCESPSMKTLLHVMYK